VHVRVDEARHQRAAGQVHHGRGACLGLRSLDPDDAAGPDADGTAGREEPVAIEDRAMTEKELCIGVHLGLPFCGELPGTQAVDKANVNAFD
jgi:hypothetical protein